MRRMSLSRTIVGLLLFCFGGIVLASEGDELRERAKALRKEAAVLAERGNKEQAERLTKEAAQLLEAAERLERKATEAHDLAAQLLERAAAMEREVQEGKRRLAAAMHKAHGKEQGGGVVQELRAEIERLRAEVKELRQRLEKR
ncbi:MAG: hypothetical protein FJ271_12695 [Planctomycetes bacterium]|nr:hypothetical protein [Planctomycetota bacterium]